MKIRNISKKIIGNEKFRLLPGGEMVVSGDEAWVKNYLERKKMEVIEQGAPTTATLDVGDQAEQAKQKAAEAKAAKDMKKAWADILKNGDPEEIMKLADELGIATDNVPVDELINMVKIAIK